MIDFKDAYVFFNTKVESSGALSWIGDLGLAPFRYLCGGRTIRLETVGQTVTIHSVASFHTEGKRHFSRTNYHLTSSSTHMIKAIFSVICVVPGFFFALVKLVSYTYEETRNWHLLAKEHLTPRNLEIGTFDQPIKTYQELYNALDKAKRDDTKNQPLDALIIHGHGNLEINEDPGILQFNPMKLILEGATIVHRPSSSMSGRLDDRMYGTKKWIVRTANPNPSSVPNSEYASVGKALEAPLQRRGWLTCKCFHKVFQVPRLATT